MASSETRGAPMIDCKRRRLVAALVAAILSTALVQTTLSSELKPIKSHFEEAVRQVEDQLGRKLSINPIVLSAQTQSVGYFGLSVVSMMCIQDSAGLKFASADRRGATDAEWKEAVAILAALVAPDGPVAEKQRALVELLDARAQGKALAKEISNSWIVARAIPQEGENWFAFQRGSY